MTSSTQTMYTRLAEFLIAHIDLEVSILLEVGCGQGQLTIPFARKIGEYLDNFKLIALDLSTGPYTNNLEVLKNRVQQEGLESVISIIQGDVRDMSVIEDKVLI